LERLRFKGLDFIGNVTCGDDVTFELDGAVDDGDVVGVGDEGDDEVVLGDSVVEVGCRGDIKGDWSRMGDSFAELFGFG
jgi:hypothetical protein